MKKLIPIILSFLVLFAGCATTKAKTLQETLTGNWNTISLTFNGVAQEICQSNIEFEKQGSIYKAGGCAGFNLYYGDAKLKNGQINVDNLALTKMMGPPAAMDFEDLFLTGFVYGKTYTIEDDVLTIVAPDRGIVMQLRKEK